MVRMFFTLVFPLMVSVAADAPLEVRSGRGLAFHEVTPWPVTDAIQVNQPNDRPLFVSKSPEFVLISLKFVERSTLKERVTLPQQKQTIEREVPAVKIGLWGSDLEKLEFLIAARSKSIALSVGDHIFFLGSFVLPDADPTLIISGPISDDDFRRLQGLTRVGGNPSHANSSAK